MPMNYEFTEKTRRKMSEAAKQRSTPEYRQRMSIAKRLVLDERKIIALYLLGFTLDEVAREMGTSAKPVLNCLKRRGIPRRSKAKRNQLKENNPQWKGDRVTYKGAHCRISSWLGQPKKCENCGTTNPSIKYEWASMSGKYHDPHDYKRLCCSCHKQLDKPWLKRAKDSWVSKGKRS